jgi:hypothetical protein
MGESRSAFANFVWCADACIRSMELWESR